MKKFVIKLFITVISSFVALVFLSIIMIIYFSFDLPTVPEVAHYIPPVPSQIISRDGIVLTELGKEDREIVYYNEVPKIIIDAFISAEDASFFDHSGIDYAGIFRAFIANLKAGKIVQGGSTITQQVAKSFLDSKKRSIQRKIKDFLLAQRIEKNFTKEEILFFYLNQVYLGNGYYGIKAAFKGYFNKELKDVTIAEAAMLAGLLVAPGKYSPYINPLKAKVRQKYVLNRMLTNKIINQKEYDDNLNKILKFYLDRESNYKAPYFVDWIRRKVINLVGEDKFLKDGFKIYTTLDYKLQEKAELEVIKGIKEIDKRQGYRGSLANINNSEESLFSFYKQFRENIYRNNSNYFTIDADYKKVYQLELGEHEFEKIKEYKDKFLSVYKGNEFIPGFYLKDRFLKYIKKNKEYKAVVTRVDDNAKIIYINIAGIDGIIPQKNFRWAHPRNLSSQRQYFSYVETPSSIVKPGDIILVSIQNKSERIINHLPSALKKRLNNLKREAKFAIKRQKYLLAYLDQIPISQGALVSINPYSGEIISFVGGTNFSKSQFNRITQAIRQPGSAFKPILYATALENDYTPSSLLIDSPESLGGMDSKFNWKPKNYDGKFKGVVTLRNSLELSRNVPTVKLAYNLGIRKIKDFCKRIGIKTKLKEDLSISLGSVGLTLMDMVSIYSIFSNGGRKIKPKAILSIVDRFGKNYSIEKLKEESEANFEVKDDKNNSSKFSLDEKEDLLEDENKSIYTTHLSGNQVYDSRLAYIMTNLLRGVILYGTGRSAKSAGQFISGKTGTTNDYIDAWFIGYSSNIVTGVWTGNDNNTTLGWGESGAKAALPIWREYMKYAIPKTGEDDFPIPRGIINVMVDKESGKLADLSTKSKIMEKFVEGTEPGSKTIEENIEEKNNLDNNSQIIEDDDYYNSQ